MKKMSFINLLFLVFCIVFVCDSARAQTSTFTYQGKLTDTNNAANGQYDFTFRLFDAAAGGVQIGTDAVLDNVQVTNGIFTVNLDFSATAFSDGRQRFLEISVRAGASTGAFTTLSPRQQVTSSPYSIKSLNATNADTSTNSLNLGGVAAGQYVITTDSRLSDDRNPLPNSPNYIQNTTSQQSSSNFNISGNGTAGGTLSGNIVNVEERLSVGGGMNIDQNNANSGSVINTLRFGNSSGEAIGSRRTAGGNQYGLDFYTNSANRMVITNGGNIGIGTTAPTYKLQVIDATNTGLRVQTNATGGTVASFGGFGDFYVDAPGVTGGRFRIAENGNVGIGGTVFPDSKLTVSGTGIVRSTINSNSNAGLKLSLSDLPKWSLATVGNGQFQIFNEANGQNAFWIDPTTNNVGIGTTAPQQMLSIAGGMNIDQNDANNGSVNNALRFGNSSGEAIGSQRTAGGNQWGLDFYTNSANRMVITNSGNVGIGTTAPQAKFHIGENNGRILFGNVCNLGVIGIGFGATLTCDNYSLLGNGTDLFINRRAGGSIFFLENSLTQMVLSPDGSVTISGRVTINMLGSGGSTQLCRNASNQISGCSSSLRYKTNIAPFSSGLSFINQLRPITFDWKQGGIRDVGFGAEEVAKINPLFVTYNEKGEVEGVKYDRLSVAFVNAFKEQQQIIERQQQQIDALKKLVCELKPEAAICKE